MREDIISRNAQGDPLIFNLNIEAIIDFKTNKDFQVIINEFLALTINRINLNLINTKKILKKILLVK